jgi:hypothetical protein
MWLKIMKAFFVKRGSAIREWIETHRKTAVALAFIGLIIWWSLTLTLILILNLVIDDTDYGY